jgi:outer membrane autotransporter protein
MGRNALKRRDWWSPLCRRAGSTLRLALLVAAGIVLGMSGPASAQSLNESVAKALSDNCAAFPSTGSLSSGLDRICGIPATGSGVSSGGVFSLDNQTGGTAEERRARRRITERRASVRTGAASADAGSGAFGLFGSVEYTSFNKDLTRFESGYHSDTAGLTIGGDYRLSDALLVGGAFNYNREMGDFAGASGGFDVDTYGPLLYVGIQPFTNAFIDLTAGVSAKDYYMNRLVFLNFAGRGAGGRIKSDADGTEWKASVATGYDFIFGRFTVGPRLGMNFRHNRIDEFQETGDTGLELAFEDQHRTSITSVAGLHGSVAISTGFGVLVPQANFEYLHEFADDQRVLGFSFVGDPARTRFTYRTDEPDRDYFHVGAGAVLALPNGWSPFINYRTLVGYSDRSSHTVSLGLRVAF